MIDNEIYETQNIGDIISTSLLKKGFKKLLPLRITFALKGKRGFFALESSLNLAERLKLYLVEFEPDEINLEALLNKLSKQGVILFKRTINVTNINLLEKVFDFKHFFTEIQFCLPYSFTKNELVYLFTYLEKINKKNDVVLACFINNSNIDKLELCLELATKIGIKKIVIPNPDLVRHLKFVKRHYLSNKDLAKLDIIKKYMDTIEFRIHDFFIAKRLKLKDAELFRGCQAGKFLCYVFNGKVYPCKTVPIFCGDITKEPFENIWERVQQEINKVSKGKQCINCNNSKICYYGCPGAIFFVNDGIKDPLCEE